MTAQKNLAAALVVAQSAMDNAALNKVNPHFKSAYADLASVRAATLPALNANGLALLQYFAADGNGGLLLYTRLVHEGGEHIESVYPIAFDRPQVMGSAITYGRRYSWAAMCGIAAEEDDDANAAQGDKNPNKKSKAKARPEYEDFEKGMRACKTKAELAAWNADNAADIEALPDDWLRQLDIDYRRTMEGLPA